VVLLITLSDLRVAQSERSENRPCGCFSGNGKRYLRTHIGKCLLLRLELLAGTKPYPSVNRAKDPNKI
jgi:hypothetical protein